MTRLVFLPLLASCGSTSEPGWTYPSPSAQALRTSMAIRGMRPTPEALADVANDPTALPRWVDTWLASPAFGDTLRDMHAEQLLIRADTDDQLPAYGPLTGYTTAEIHEGTVEAPLKLIERVVMESRPYTEIVTADWLLVSDVYATVHGLPFDPAGPAWQETQWGDGRPRAGLLSDSEMWRRHRSAGSNFHRGRANLVASMLLCEDFATRDVLIEGGVDLSDAFAVADAVRNQPTCVGCHQAMDPLAGFFWGFRHQLKARAVRTAYSVGCEWPVDDPAPLPGQTGAQEDFCYPLRFYQPELENDWIDWDLRTPSYYGQPAADLADVGRLIADDPRFATCTARRFWSYLAQEPLEHVDDALATELADVLVRQGWDARELVRAIVLHPRFLAVEGPPEVEVVGTLHARPEQLSRTMADLTGFQWLARMDVNGCEDDCWGVVDLATTDRIGFRAMAGGVDGLTVLHPTYSATPTRRLFLERFATEAAAHVVRDDSALARGQRRLLTEVQGDGSDGPEAVRAQIAALLLRISAEPVPPDAPDVLAAEALYNGVRNTSGDSWRAWTVVIAALLQDDRMEFY